jgi:hypothetical protein
MIKQRKIGQFWRLLGLSGLSQEFNLAIEGALDWGFDQALIGSLTALD